MAFSFPTSPTNGQTYVQGGVTYTFDSSNDTWVGTSGGGVVSTTGILSGTAEQDYQVTSSAPTTRSDGTSSLVEGDMWYDTSTDTLNVRSGAGTWLPSSSGGSTSGVNTGTTAQDYQVAAAAPTTRSVDAGSGALVEGDLWYDTTYDVLYVRSGASTWVSSLGGASGTTSATVVTYTQVFSGNAGNQWYDLAQHGPGTYRVTYASTYETFFTYSPITSLAVAVATVDTGNNTYYTSLPSGATGSNKGHSVIRFENDNLIRSIQGDGVSNLARYVGSKTSSNSLSITKVERVNQ